jgi:histidinol-phosphate phosphatase family protein
MQLVILAGGKGTRLGLADIPKPMVAIAGKPLLEYQIELAKRYGLTEIFILSGYLADVIINHFGDGSAFGVNIHHVVEPSPLGTAGALKLLDGKLTGRFMVFYGDIAMDFDIPALIEFDRKDSETLGSIIVHPNSHPYDSDLVAIDAAGYVTSFLMKSQHAEVYRNLVSAAVYVLSPRIMNYLKEDVFADFGKDVFPAALKNGERIRAYITPEYITDMGTKDRFARVCKDVESGKVRRLNRKYSRPAIFLDRDGVINENMDNDISFDSFHLLPEVTRAIALVNKSDYLCIVVTNQPMIAKGFITFEELEKIHKKMETLLGQEGAFIDGIFFCPHHPEKGFEGEIPELKIDCVCRKPKTGMFTKAQKDFNIDMSRSWMIGDSETDILAGKNTGCKTIIIGAPGKYSAADYQKKHLFDAVKFVLGGIE